MRKLGLLTLVLCVGLFVTGCPQQKQKTKPTPPAGGSAKPDVVQPPAGKMGEKAADEAKAAEDKKAADEAKADEEKKKADEEKKAAEEKKPEEK